MSEETPPTTEVHVAQVWFDHIHAGRKSIEGRIGRDVYLGIREGHPLTFFTDGGDRCQVFVSKIEKFRSFIEMLTHFWNLDMFHLLLPGVPDINSGLAIYRQFYGEEEELAKGVLAIH